MLRISTFGRLALDDETGPVGGVGSWRPTLAALALLAASGEQGVPRERLLSLLWPESAPERARNSLKQLLSALRRALPDATIPGTTLLRLDRGKVSCDLWDFQSAIARGDLDAAVSVYAGPFLDGFSLPGAVEFERWSEGERVRLSGELHRALETLAERASSAGDHRTAVAHMRRLASAEPLDSDVALRLMLTLVASGNRAGALHHFDIHAALVQQELECEPDPAIVEYASVLRDLPRAAIAGISSRVISADAPPTRAVSSMTRQEVRADTPTLRLVSDDADLAARTSAPDDAPIHVDRGAKSSAPAPSRRRRRSLVAASVAAGVVLGFAVFGLFSDFGKSHGGVIAESADASIATPSVVAVMPFSVQGSASLQHLGDGLADLLSSRLDGAGPLRSVDSRVILQAAQGDAGRPIDQRTASALARRLSARFFVVGSVAEIAGRLRIGAYLFDRDAGTSPVARADVETTADSIFAAADALAARLLADRLRAPAERLSRNAALSTTSIPALKAFLTGEDALREGHLNEAAAAFRRAVAADSTFALAHYRASQGAEWTGRDEDVLSEAEHALRFADQLSSQDSLLVRAYLTWRTGNLDDAERLYRAEVDDHPDDVEGWFQLGELLFHDNPLRGRTSTEARTPFQRVVSLDPGNAEALVHLARIAYTQGRRADVDSLVRRVRALVPDRDVLELRAFRAFALGDAQGQKRVTSELLASPGSVPAMSALEVAVFADDLAGAERFGALLTGEERSADVRDFGYRLLAQTAAARGQWRVSQMRLSAATQLDSVTALELRARLVVLPFLPVSRAELESTRTALLAWRPSAHEAEDAIHFKAHLGLHPSLRTYFLGLVSARLGDTAAAVAYARELERATERRVRRTVATARATFARSVRARVADAAGDPERALALLSEAQWAPIASDVMIEALDRFYRAELLRRLGRVDEARGWYASMAQRATYELPYLAPSHLQLARLAEARGDRAEARRLYGSFVESWRSADPELAPLVQEARLQIAKLGG
jgi:serine/threonine-protein kinase